VSDIDTAVVDSLKVLDPNRPIREADIDQLLLTKLDFCVRGLVNWGGPVVPSGRILEKCRRRLAATPCLTRILWRPASSLLQLRRATVYSSQAIMLRWRDNALSSTKLKSLSRNVQFWKCRLNRSTQHFNL
jgi:hypothetical protein